MRIVAVHERTILLATAAHNASIGFAGMTASAVAVHTDAQRNGKPLTGLAFDSIGRYAHGGLLRERFIPRLLAAEPDAYDDGSGGIDPRRAWTVMSAGGGRRATTSRPGSNSGTDRPGYCVRVSEPPGAHFGQYNGAGVVTATGLRLLHLAHR